MCTERCIVRVVCHYIGVSTLQMCLLCLLLGMKQSGASLGDVVLPPWAKGDAREFIRAHREVCDKLPRLVDLIPSLSVS